MHGLTLQELGREMGRQWKELTVRLHIIRNARIQSTGQPQSCMAVTDGAANGLEAAGDG